MAREARPAVQSLHRIMAVIGLGFVDTASCGFRRGWEVGGFSWQAG